MKIIMLSVHGDPGRLDQLGEKDIGGQCLYINEVMKQLVEMGHQVDAYTRKWGDRDEIEYIIKGNENARVIRIPCAGTNEWIPKEKLKPHFTEFYNNLKQFIEQHDLEYDIIGSHYWDAGKVGTWMKEEFNIPLVHTSHSLGVIKKESIPKEERAGLAFEARIQDETTIYQKSDAVVAESKQEKDALVNSYHIDSDKIHIVPAGVDIDWYKPTGSKDAAKDELGFDKDYLVLSLGRLDTRKGFDLMTKMVPHVKEKVKEQGKTVKFIISAGSLEEFSKGEKRQYDKIMAICDRLNITKDDFEIIPRIEPYERVLTWYTASDVFLCPSRYETFGLVIVEAMACKTPVVATNNGGPPDIITNGLEGYTVNPEATEAFADKIFACIQNRKKNQLMGETARKTVVDKFSWQAVTQQLYDLFTSVI